MKLNILLVFLPIFVFAQTITNKSLSFVHFTTDNGLPYNSIKDIEFDKNSYCWLATEVGAVRYDGLSFSRIKLDPNRPGRIGYFSKTIENDLYLVNDVWNKLIIRMDTLGIWNISTDSDKNVLFSSYGYAYCQGLVDSLLKKHSIPQFNEKSSEHTILGTSNQGFYIIGLNQLAFFDSTAYRRYQDIQTRGVQNYFLLGNDLLLWEDKLNKFSIYRKGKRIHHRVSIYTSDRVPLRYDEKKIKLLWHNNCVFLFYNDIVYQLEYRSNRLMANELFKNIQIENPISIAYNRADGIYFIGTLSNGLYIIQSTPFKTVAVHGGKRSENNEFYAQAEVGNNIFASGLLIDSLVNSTIIIKDIHTFNLLSHSSNELWISRKQSGFIPELYSFHHKKGTTVSLDSFYNLTKGLFKSNCDSKILFLCAESLGVINNFRYKPILFNKNKAFTTLLDFNCDTLIIGTKRGLFFYNQKLKKIGGLVPLGEVRTIQKDRENRIWIGTYLSGYFIWNPQRGFYKPNLDMNNRLESVHAFYFDKRDYIWMSTNNGLIRVKRQNALNDEHPNYEIFEKSDGFLTNEFNGGCHPSVLELSDGRVSFPSINGLVIFHPDSIQIQRLDSRIYITRIKTNHIETGLDYSLRFKKEIRHVEFEFSTPYYGNRDNLHYEYKLYKQSGEWMPLSGSKLILNNLDAGTHDFCIRIAEHPSIFREIQFVIEPYFYETIWFQMLLASIVLILIYFMQRFRIQRIYKRNEEFDLRIAEKMIKLESTIEKLEISESEMRSLVVIQEKIMNIVLHDMQSPLQFLQNIAEDARTALRSKNLITMDDKLNVLSRSLNRITNFTSSFFNWIYYQRKGIKPHFTSVNLDEIFTELLKIYENADSENQISYTPSMVKIYTDRDILTIILKNILDNANKHARQGIISIISHSVDDFLTIQIKDTGKGMASSTVKSLLSQNYLNEEATFHGFGYKIIVELCKLIQGELDISSSSSGTIVYLKLMKQNEENI